MVAVSHQGVTDDKTFKSGLLRAIDTIQSEAICWYGNIPEYISRYYDMEKIVRMETRYTLLSTIRMPYKLPYSHRRCDVLELL